MVLRGMGDCAGQEVEVWRGNSGRAGKHRQGRQVGTSYVVLRSGVLCDDW